MELTNLGSQATPTDQGPSSPETLCPKPPLLVQSGYYRSHAASAYLGASLEWET